MRFTAAPGSARVRPLSDIAASPGLDLQTIADRSAGGSRNTSSEKWVRKNISVVADAAAPITLKELAVARDHVLLRASRAQDAHPKELHQRPGVE